MSYIVLERKLKIVQRELVEGKEGATAGNRMCNYIIIYCINVDYIAMMYTAIIVIWYDFLT